jgi:hypothetical protein
MNVADEYERIKSSTITLLHSIVVEEIEGDESIMIDKHHHHSRYTTMPLTPYRSIFFSFKHDKVDVALLVFIAGDTEDKESIY